MEYLKLIMSEYSFSANMEIVIKAAWIEKWCEHVQNPTAVFPLPALSVGTAQWVRCGLAVTKCVSLSHISSIIADFWEVQSHLPGPPCIYVFMRDKL